MYNPQTQVCCVVNETLNPAPLIIADCPQQVQADIMAAADKPLESALAALLNNLLWDVERHSIDGSMDE